MLTPRRRDLDVVLVHGLVGGLPVQEGGPIRQVQRTQLGGAVGNWEKPGAQRRPRRRRCCCPQPSSLPTPWPPCSVEPQGSPLPPPSPQQLCSLPPPLLVPGAVCITRSQEACERLTLLKATDGDHGHLVASVWGQPLEGLGLGPAVH